MRARCLKGGGEGEGDPLGLLEDASLLFTHAQDFVYDEPRFGEGESWHAGELAQLELLGGFFV